VICLLIRWRTMWRTKCAATSLVLCIRSAGT